MSALPSTPSATRTTAIWLGAAGALPFIAAVLAGLLLADSLIAQWTEQAAFLYGAVILSFLGGIHWGLALTRARADSRAYIIGVIPSLVGWGAVLLPMRIGLVVLALGFIGQFLMDLRLSLPGWFRTLRLALTIVVSASLFLLAMLE
jgi:hypothetical protein